MIIMKVKKIVERLMKFRYNISVIILLMFNAQLNAQLIPNLGGQRVGISAFQFLKIGVGARATALGESFVAIGNDASSLYWNPAGLLQVDGNQVILSHTQFVADIKHQFFGAIYKLTPSDIVGVSIISLSMNDMPVTNETNPHGTGEMFKYGDLGIGVTYARQLTNQFSFGTTIKYIDETLDILKMRSVLVDIGTYYWTGLGTVRFAVVVTNFGGNVSPSGSVTLFNDSTVSSFQSFSPPTLFKVGVAFEPYQTELHKITLSIQLNHPNDNVENIRIGTEYTWNDLLSLRVGLKRTFGEQLLGKDGSSEDDFTCGFGVKVPVSFSKMNVDYSFANFNRLGGVHRISLLFTY